MCIRDRFNTADQVRRGLITHADLRGEGFIERVLDGCALIRGKVERAAHDTGVRGCLESFAEGIFGVAVHLAQAAREHFAQAFFQAHGGEIGQRLSRNGDCLLYTSRCV